MAVLTLSKIEELKKNFSAEIEKLKESLPLPKNRIARFETKIDEINILNWLEAQTAGAKLYWSNREGDCEMAGIGIAYALHGTSVIDYDAINTELQKYLTAENPHLKFYGGIAFNQNAVDKCWEPFGKYRFVLPRFEIIRRKSDTFFACNIFGATLTENRLDEINALLKSLSFDSVLEPKLLPKPSMRSDEPSDEEWVQELRSVIKELSTENLQKVVLARKSAFKFPATIDPVMLLKRLKETSTDCYHFCFQVDEENAFIGASPERLYKRVEKLLETEALAGTRPRGKSPEEDKRLKDELVLSTKDRYEHSVVVESIKTAVSQIATNIEVNPAPMLLALKSGLHLLTPIRATLNKDVDDAMILKMLHPTPAVGGEPTDRAVSVINRFEPFKRGWYAGPVGCIGYKRAEFAVGIRSGLITNQKLSLFAGAGLVKGSNPKEEWDEIETKISNFLQIFTNGD